MKNADDLSVQVVQKLCKAYPHIKAKLLIGKYIPSLDEIPGCIFQQLYRDLDCVSFDGRPFEYFWILTFCPSVNHCLNNIILLRIFCDSSAYAFE